MKWLKEHPRRTLLLALAGVPVLLLVLLAVGKPLEDAAAITGLAFVLPCLIPVNGWALRRRGRSLAWLLFYPVAGLGIIPLLLALVARPGRTA